MRSKVGLCARPSQLFPWLFGAIGVCWLLFFFYSSHSSHTSSTASPSSSLSSSTSSTSSSSSSSSSRKPWPSNDPTIVQESAIPGTRPTPHTTFPRIPVPDFLTVLADTTASGCDDASLDFAPLNTMPISEFPFCVVTAPRSRDVEYLSATIKSWTRATAGSDRIFYVVVGEAHFGIDATLAYLADLCHHSPSLLPNVVVVRRGPRARPVLPPTRSTMGDPMDRMRWRSKEVQDYVFALETCVAASHPSAAVLGLVQDDVAFSAHAMARLDGWLEASLLSGEQDEQGRNERKENGREWLAVTLWDCNAASDLAPKAHDGGVAKVWNQQHVPGVVQYLLDKYEEQPVDFLVSNYAAGDNALSRALPIFNHAPNPVEHCGASSSFNGNVRKEKSSTYMRNPDASEFPCEAPFLTRAT